MALISNPFTANVPKTMNAEEVIQSLREDIINEYEAIIGYEAHVEATTDERVKKVLSGIAEEEKGHIGQLEQLIYLLKPNDQGAVDKGKQIVQNKQNNNFQ
ncbi:rubrerythrin family protein [Caproicibacter sp.]|uniref:rubrerythrin family protein n=1 Tax=Caproicibacter sp. TaxID=2814884 RepID=UPI003989ADFF